MAEKLGQLRKLHTGRIAAQQEHHLAVRAFHARQHTGVVVGPQVC